MPPDLLDLRDLPVRTSSAFSVFLAKATKRPVLAISTDNKAFALKRAEELFALHKAEPHRTLGQSPMVIVLRNADERRILRFQVGTPITHEPEVVITMGGL